MMVIKSEVRGHGLTIRYYPSICLEELKKTTKSLSEYTATAPRFEPRFSQNVT
jgi:hypothetical protein